MSVPVIQLRAAAPPLGYRHVQLAELERWGCWWRGHGAGVVVGRIELAGQPVGYDIMHNGVVSRAWQADVRPFYVVAS